MELNFLTIADSPEDLGPVRALLAPFEHEAHMQVPLRRIGWDRAWQTLLLEAVEGKGPHVSQIGSTWVATMAMLDALRVFSEAEANSMGGAEEFLPSAWKTVTLRGSRDIWAIPWSIYTFVLFYRRDLLLRANLDPATAFLTPETMHDSFIRLQAKGIAPWAFPSLHPYADLVHIASSWARANGGDFVSAEGRKPLFAKPEARSGLLEFFELFPFIPSQLRGFSVEQCTEAFARGDAAVLVGGLEVADELLASPYASPEMRANLGMTTLPGLPWIGGDHLTVWRNALADPEHEQAAVDLVRYLTRKETQVEFFHAQNILPARKDAYSTLTFPLDTTPATLQKILEKGCPHPPVHLWRRIEAFLDDMLLNIGSTILRQPSVPAADTAGALIDDYEGKLTAILKG